VREFLPLLGVPPFRDDRPPLLLPPSEVGVLLRLLAALPLPCVLRLDDDVRLGVSLRVLGTATMLVLTFAGCFVADVWGGVTGAPGKVNFLSFGVRGFFGVTSLSFPTPLPDNLREFSAFAGADFTEDPALVASEATGLRTVPPLLTTVGLFPEPPKLVLPLLGPELSGVFTAALLFTAFPGGDRYDAAALSVKARVTGAGVAGPDRSLPAEGSLRVTLALRGWRSLCAEAGAARTSTLALRPDAAGAAGVTPSTALVRGMFAPRMRIRPRSG
jgi:hypothetical protein